MAAVANVENDFRNARRLHDALIAELFFIAGTTPVLCVYRNWLHTDLSRYSPLFFGDAFLRLPLDFEPNARRLV